LTISRLRLVDATSANMELIKVIRIAAIGKEIITITISGYGNFGTVLIMED